MIRQIDPNTFGSASFVSSLTTCRDYIFGGFIAWLVAQDQPEPGAILLSALKWKGPQPRLVLYRRDCGYDEWLKLLETAKEHVVTHRFVGSAEAASNPYDQWLTAGPSPLLS